MKEIPRLSFSYGGAIPPCLCCTFKDRKPVEHDSMKYLHISDLFLQRNHIAERSQCST